MWKRLDKSYTIVTLIDGKLSTNDLVLIPRSGSIVLDDEILALMCRVMPCMIRSNIRITDNTLLLIILLIKSPNSGLNRIFPHDLSPSS